MPPQAPPARDRPEEQASALSYEDAFANLCKLIRYYLDTYPEKVAFESQEFRKHFDYLQKWPEIAGILAARVDNSSRTRFRKAVADIDKPVDELWKALFIASGLNPKSQRKKFATQMGVVRKTCLQIATLIECDSNLDLSRYVF